MKQRIVIRANIVLIGGPEDGREMKVDLRVPPGELPRYGVFTIGRKHVYQSTTLHPDDCGLQPMRFEHVQILNPDEDIYG